MLPRDTHGLCMEDLDELSGMFLHMLSYRRSTIHRACSKALSSPLPTPSHSAPSALGYACLAQP
jgi:hypothetical protein